VSLKQIIEQQHAAWATLGRAPLLESIVLKAGVEFQLDAEAAHGFLEDKFCFQNSIHHALKNGLRYVEGFAIRPDLGIPMHHAWVELKNGKVQDVTWGRPVEDRCEYFGVAFQADEAWAAMVASEHYGLFDFMFPSNLEFVRARWPDLLPKEEVL
jgi:hypothetical protein